MERKNFDEIAARLRQQGEAPSTPHAGASGHLRTLETQIQSIARGDVAAVLEHVADDVTLEIFGPPEFPFLRAAQGAGAFRQAIEHNFAVVADQKPEVRDLFAEGEKIVLFGRETGTLRATGLRYDVEFVQRFTFRGGLLSAVQVIVAHTRPVGD